MLQVLLSQVHRLRALVLLGRFLDMGPWAVDLALSVGIFPYVLKLLQVRSLSRGRVRCARHLGPCNACRLLSGIPEETRLSVPRPTLRAPTDDVVRPAHHPGVHLGQDPGAGHQLPG